MELRQLKYFYSAASHLNFTTAAKECFIVQTTMSQQIRQLEKELGVTLFIRNKNMLSLTPAGEQLKKDAEQILLQVSLAENNLSLLQSVSQDKLSIGFYGDGLGADFPPILQKLKEDHPNLELQFFHDTQSRLLHLLETEQVDCIINLLPPVDEQKHPDWLRCHLICKSPFVLIAAPDVLNVPTGTPISLDAELPLPLITLTDAAISNIKQELIPSGQDLPTITNPFPTTQTLKLLTLCRQILMLCPKVAITDTSGLVFFPIANLPLEIPIYLMWKQGHGNSKNIQRFLSACQNYYSSL